MYLLTIVIINKMYKCSSACSSKDPKRLDIPVKENKKNRNMYRYFRGYL